MATIATNTSAPSAIAIRNRASVMRRDVSERSVFCVEIFEHREHCSPRVVEGDKREIVLARQLAEPRGFLTRVAVEFTAVTRCVARAPTLVVRTAQEIVEIPRADEIAPLLVDFPRPLRLGLAHS